MQETFAGAIAFRGKFWYIENLDRALVFDFDFDFGRVIKSHKISSIQSGTMASCLWRIYNSKYKLKD